MVWWQLLLLGAGVLIVVVDVIVHVVYAFPVLKRFENRPAFLVLPPPLTGPDPEIISIDSTDGIRLSGGIYFPADGEPRGVIIFGPETDGNFATSMNYAAALLESGFAVISINFRNQSTSGYLPTYKPLHWMTEYEVADLHATLEFVKSQPQFADLPIGMMGVSRGGAAVLAAGATRPEVQAVWAQGAFSTHGLLGYYCLKWVELVVGQASRFIPKWHILTTAWVALRMAEWRNGCRYLRLEPLLSRWQNREAMFVSGERDTYVPAGIGRELCRLAGHSTDTDHWVVKGARHNMERLTTPAEFDQRLTEFFSRILEDSSVSCHRERMTASRV